MTDGLVRGRWIARTSELLQSLTRDDVAHLEALTNVEELAQRASTFESGGWYPRRIHVELLGAIANACAGEVGARALLERCGRAVASEDADPFLGLALKSMSPALFAHSLSKLWAMDHQTKDAFVVDACNPVERRATVRLVHVADYAHVAPLVAGWMKALLPALDAKPTVTEAAWSLRTPAPGDVRFELAWSGSAGVPDVEEGEAAELRERIVGALLTLSEAHRDGYGSAPVLMLRGPTPLKVVFAWINEMLNALAAENEQAVAFRRQLSEKLLMVDQQRAAIRDLSTPIIEVWNGVLCLPVVGVIDTARSVDMTSTLLSAIIQKDARYAIVDITGIEVMDTRTADHFVQMAKAVRLIGARCALAGVSPQIAQTVVGMGVDLHELTTYRNLREALLEGIQRR